MTDYGFLLLLVGAYLTYRFVIKPRFLQPPKKEKEININSPQEKKDFEGGEFFDYEEVKE